MWNDSHHNPSISRRDFLATTGGAVFALSAGIASPAAGAPAPFDPATRIRGLMLGSALGDALGGPIEFQAPDAVRRLPNGPKLWRDDEVLDAGAKRATMARLELRSYLPLRPVPESYAQWNSDSPAGTITDDTRHKLILMHTLRSAEARERWPVTAGDFAQAYLDWPSSDAVTKTTAYRALAADWLEEYQMAARWLLGERDLGKARPTARLWNGLPTCSGQMALLPLAALFPGEPEQAYRAAHSLAFIDNGWAKDMIGALAAGLAVALVTPADPAKPGAAWKRILQAIRETDPYGYGKIRWTERSVTRWLNLALKLAETSQGRPARLFAALEKQFAQTTKWEAQVPFTVIFSCLALADHDPLASLQLSMEWGHDTDSYAQLLGAFIGALHGPELFRPEWIAAVTRRLDADHGVKMDDECALLLRLARLAKTRTIIAVE